MTIFKNSLLSFVSVFVFVLDLFVPFLFAQSAEKIIEEETKSLYQTLHSFPELGHQEHTTSQTIRAYLQKAGYAIYDPGENLKKKLPTLVMAILETQKLGPVLCFRAEMDALFIPENTGLAFSSQNTGIMHACGHDAHMSILLSFAKALQEKKEQLRGKVVFLFQPAEEVAGGADDIVRDGVLDRLQVEAIFALHVTNQASVGTIQISPGPVLAGSNFFSIELTGKPGHPAFPHESSDLVLASAQIALDIAKIPARRIDILECPTIISITNLQAGKTLPKEAKIQGTVRSFFSIEDPPYSIQKLVETHIASHTTPFQIEAKIQWKKGAPPTINDKNLYTKWMPMVQKQCPDFVFEPAKKSMASEDFAYYTQKYPGLYFYLGIAKDNLGKEMVHSDQFSIHPDCLEVGRKLWLAIAFAILGVY